MNFCSDPQLLEKQHFGELERVPRFENRDSDLITAKVESSMLQVQLIYFFYFQKYIFKKIIENGRFENIHGALTVFKSFYSTGIHMVKAKLMMMIYD